MLNREIIENVYPSSIYNSSFTYSGNTLINTGDNIIIGDPGYDSVDNENLGSFSLMNKVDDYWVNVKTTVYPEQNNQNTSTGFSNSLDLFGDHLIVGSYLSGQSFLFNITNLEQHITIEESDINSEHFYGVDVSISDKHVAIGAPRFGSNGCIFLYDKETLITENNLNSSKLVPPDDNEANIQNIFYGKQLKLSNNFLIVTAYLHKNRGSAYVYKFINENWSFRQLIQPNDLMIGSNFGITDEYA